jgi:hypothetical protein
MVTTTNYKLDQEIDLDVSLDDIPELPGYVQLYSGAYHVVLNKGIELREIERDGETINNFSVEMEVLAVVEQSDKLKTDKDPVIKERSGDDGGDIQSFLFARNHAVAMSNFKKFIAVPIGEKLGLTQLREIIEGSKGLELMIVGKRSYNKEKDQYNFNLTACEVV